MGSVARKSIQKRFMVDDCQIMRPGVGEGVLDEVTFEVTAPADVLVYSGICAYSDRVRTRSIEEGGAAIAEAEGVLKIPADTDNVRVGDLVDITKSSDPITESLTFTIVRVLASTNSLTRTLYCRRVDAFAPGALIS